MHLWLLLQNARVMAELQRPWFGWGELCAWLQSAVGVS
jgi:hypothetical protein